MMSINCPFYFRNHLNLKKLNFYVLIVRMLLHFAFSNRILAFPDIEKASSVMILRSLENKRVLVPNALKQNLAK